MSQQSVGTVVLDVNTNTAPLQSKLSSLSKTAGGMASGMFSKLGFAIAGAFSIGAITMFSKSAIKMASTLTEIQNVVDVTFGSMNQELNTWSKNALTNFGVSETAAKRYASTLGAMFKSMGMGQKDTYAMSTSLARLAGDLASFYNLSADEAFQKIQAGISGETEPLKRLGINMSQANMDAFALSKGLSGTYQSMSQVNKAQLAYQYLMSVTKDQQGDFIRTSDSWANQTRILSEQWKIFMTTIGKGLIGVFTPFLRVLNLVMLKLQVVAQYMAAFMGLFSKKTQEDVKNTASTNYDMSDSLSGVGASAKKAGKDIKGSLASFDQLNVIGESASASLDKVSSSATDLDFGSAINTVDAPTVNTAGMESALNQVKTMAESVRVYLADTFGTAFQTALTTGSMMLQGYAGTMTTVMNDVYLGVILPVFETFKNKIFPMWGEIATKAIEAAGILFKEVKTIFDMLWTQGVKPVMDLVVGIWTEMWTIVAGNWNMYGAPIFEGIKRAFRDTGSTLQNIWNTLLKPIWDAFMLIISDLWENYLKQMFINLSTGFMELVEMGLFLYNNFILPLVYWLTDLLGPGFADFFVGVLNNAAGWIKGILSIVGDIIKAFKGIITFLSGVFTGDWKKAWQGLSDVFNNIMSAIGTVFKAPINGIISLVNGMVREINKLKIKIPDWVPLLGGKTFGVNIPEMKYLARGGVVESPTLAMVGERGKEAVMPLENNTGWIQELAGKINSQAPQSTVQTGTNEYTLEIDGTAFAKLIIKIIKDEQRRTGVNLLTT